MERWLDGEREREERRRNERRKIDSVRVGRFSPASIRREIEGVCTRCRERVRVCVCVCAPRAVCTDVDRPLCSIGAGGLAKMAVSEARRGEAK